MSLSIQQKTYLKKWLLISVIVTVIVAAGSHIWNNYYYLRLNLTDSLPGTLYLIDRHKRPTGYDDLIAFRPPNNPIYGKKFVFVKKIGGMGGDNVNVTGRTVKVNDQLSLIAKEKAKTGRPLNVGPRGVIPKNTYFVYTDHMDSYDSRYDEIGWVKDEQIVGTATILF
jgi:conjugal transfer pilin signal peptidase TrbI